eukprot:ANDGO_06391.mRNA.1 putative E3 ubiquitin-protein ligase RHC1A
MKVPPGKRYRSATGSPILVECVASKRGDNCSDDVTDEDCDSSVADLDHSVQVVNHRVEGRKASISSCSSSFPTASQASSSNSKIVIEDGGDDTDAGECELSCPRLVDSDLSQLRKDEEFARMLQEEEDRVAQNLAKLEKALSWTDQQLALRLAREEEEAAARAHQRIAEEKERQQKVERQRERDRERDLERQRQLLYEEQRARLLDAADDDDISEEYANCAEIDNDDPDEDCDSSTNRNSSLHYDGGNVGGVGFAPTTSASASGDRGDVERHCATIEHRNRDEPLRSNQRSSLAGLFGNYRQNREQQRALFASRYDAHLQAQIQAQVETRSRAQQVTRTRRRERTPVYEPPFLSNWRMGPSADYYENPTSAPSGHSDILRRLEQNGGDFKPDDYDLLLRLDEEIRRSDTKDKLDVGVATTLPEFQLTIKDVESIQKSTEKNCPICLTDFEVGDSVKMLPCMHRFHADCIVPWLVQHSSLCPVCKLDVSKNVLS